MDDSTVLLTGRLTRSPVVKGEDKKKRALFTVAVNRGTGENKRATFIDCIAWGKRADVVESLAFNKGDTLFVRGQLEQDSFEREVDGETKRVSKLQVNVDTVMKGVSNPKVVSEAQTVTVGGDENSDGQPF